MTLRIHGKRRLKSPPGLAIRPTSSRVRQTIFDMLQDRVEGCRWLDLCSGAGTMGAEALSRGASFVLGIEASRTACDIIRRNWEMVAKPGQTSRVIQGDVAAVLRKLSTGPFDIAYLDPPYQSELYGTVLPLLPRFVAPGGVLFVEHGRGRALPEEVGGLRRVSTRKYGQIEVSVYEAERLDT